MKLEELVNKYFHKLNDTDLHILNYILNHKTTCHKLGINDLAERSNVSRSSVLRLAQKLGFSGYSEFRIFLKWQKQDNRRDQKSVTEMFTNNVQETLKYIQNKNFSDICRLIHEAQRIFVFGTGTAQLNCAFELQRMFIPVKKYLTVLHSQTEFEIAVKHMSKEDVVMIISLSGDTPAIFPAVQNLVARGIPFISVTNLVHNRLARMTPYNLYASTNTDTHYYDDTAISFFVPFFMVSEALFSHYVDYIRETGEKEKDLGET